MNKQLFDLIIIGGGPGGYVAAIRAAQLGMKVVLIEKTALGGICLNWGCIPTKAMLRSAEVYRLMTKAEDFGLSTQGISFNLEKIIERSVRISQSLKQGISYLMQKNQITVITAHGRLKQKNSNNHHVQAEEKIFEAPAVILATGARPRLFPGSEPDSQRIWTSREALRPTHIPDSLCVIGSGAIGIEFAYFYQAFGSKVTVIESKPNILPTEDEDISNFAKQSFEKQGIQFYTDTAITKISKYEDHVIVHLNNQKYIKFETALTAVGVIANIEDIGLENTSIQIDNGHIVTNNMTCETHEPNIYAIGDVSAPPWLAYKASYEALVCVESIYKKGACVSHIPSLIPSCIYSDPQIASVGLTESQAYAKGYPLKIGRFSFKGNGKALALGDTEGLIKTIFHSETGELLGAHMIGPHVTELIHSLTLAKKLEAIDESFMETIFPHPTLSEMIHESVLDACGRSLHK